MTNIDKLKTLLAQPTRLEDLGIPSAIVTDLIYRVFFNEGEVSVGRFVAIIRVHPQTIDQILSDMQREHLVEVVRAGTLRFSYTYRLTDEGGKRARDAMERTQYMGPAPVDLDAYRQAILLQTERPPRIGQAEVREALRDLVLPEDFHRRIGPAVNSGSSLFLYGPPGNGKTTVAQAIARLLGSSSPIWMPYAVTAGGQIIQIFDPLVHILATPDNGSAESNGNGNGNGQGPATFGVDKRWGYFRRPAVMVGGELKMDALELRFEPSAKLYEAPLQMKANGGMFLIDDFGRQQITPQDLLNRWIVPLESGYDFLRLRSGQILEIPFRQLIVFSTNLDPNHLVDGAFLRRIQIKVEVGGPDEATFRQIFVRMCQALKVPFDDNGFRYLVQKWYREAGRPIQSVHARDVLKTIISISEYADVQPRLSPELIDEACSAYFVVSRA